MSPVRTFCAALFTSSLLWLTAWFVLINSAVSWIKPLRHFEVPNLILAEQDPLADKYKALTSSGHPFDVLLLGSSLLAVTARADAANGFVTGKENYDLACYTNAFSLDECLREKFAFSGHCFNMGLVACMVEEDLALLQESLRAGKHPKVVMLFLAPRDFIDNLHQRGTHVEQFIKDRRPWWQQVSIKETAAENANKLANCFSYIYNCRGQYLEVLQLISCKLLNRPPNLYYSSKATEYLAGLKLPKLLDADNTASAPIRKTVPSVAIAHKPKVEGPTTMYRERYLPVNYKRMSIEMVALSRILETCNQHGIAPVLINMPRTRANQQLLPQSFRTLYESQLRDACARHNTVLLDYAEDPRFADDDFLDTVHLTPDGASKLFKILSGDLAKTAVATSLGRRAS